MTYSNAEKQQCYRQRLREQGQVQGWVTPEQAGGWILAEPAKTDRGQHRCTGSAEVKSHFANHADQR